MHINKFADLTRKQFNDRYKTNKGVKVPNKKSINNEKPLILRSTGLLPDSVDWKKAGKVSLPGDQGTCGSCWAWTSASLLESLNAIQNNLKTVPRYSVQYLMDCDNVDWACDGGWMLDAFDWVKENGIVEWDSYPRQYVGMKSRCSANSSMDRFFNKGGHEEDDVPNHRIKELLTRGPVGAAIKSNYDCLAYYRSGIVTESDCQCSDPKREEVDHAITIVGYGQSE